MGCQRALILLSEPDSIVSARDLFELVLRINLQASPFEVSALRQDEDYIGGFGKKVGWRGQCLHALAA